MKSILFYTFAIIYFVFSFTSKQQNYSAKYQSPLNDTIKVKLTQKLHSISNYVDKQKITELINLNDTISGIKSDYSNTDVSKLKSYKKRLVDNVSYYKRLEIMEAFVFNIKRVVNYISELELINMKKEKIKANSRLETAKVQSERESRFVQASLDYQRLLKKENITQIDIDNYKANYPEYSKQTSKGKQKTWLELLQQLVD